MNSQLVKKQSQKLGPKSFTDDNRKYTITAFIRFDDDCNNGHNTFAITGEIRSGRRIESCGCLHEEIAEHFPELIPLIKWHLVSTDGPMHYIANTLYHVKEKNLDYARSTAVWPDATDEQLTADDLKEELEKRLPALLVEFRKAVESLGFTY